MDSCSIKLENLPNIPIKDTLQNEFNNAPRLVSTMMYILNDDMSGFNDEFLEFYKNKHNLKTKPAFKTASVAVLNKLKEAAIEFENKKNPHITSKSVTSSDRLTVVLHNYSTPEARTEGQRHVSIAILDVFKEVKFNNVPVEGNKVDYYLNRAKAKWNGFAITKIAELTGRDKREIAAEFKEAQDKHKFIYDNLCGNNKTEQSQNIYAVWCELNGNRKFAIAYLNDLFNDPLLNKVLDDTRRDLDELNDEANAESNPEANEEASTDLEDGFTELDSTVADYDHSGVKKDFNKHVSDVIRIYFDTLPKLIGGKTDTNNYYGLPTRMSAQECIQFMYSINEEFDDISSMIKAVENAAKKVSKFEAFTKFAEDLKHDQSFANEVFSVFSKPKYEFNEVVVDGAKTTTRVSNQRVNKQSAMAFDFLNDIKGSIMNSFDSMKSIYDNINNDIANHKSLLNRINNEYTVEQKREELKLKLRVSKAKLIEDITRLLKLYFPSIETDSIRAYLELNNGSSDNQFYENCKTLNSILETIVDNHPESYKAYQVKQANIQAVKDYNDNLDVEKRHAWVPANEYKTDTEFRNDDYIKNQVPAINQLVTELKPFTVGNIRLNDRNIKGNLQSAILNSSWISGLKHMMDKFYIGTDANGKSVLKNDALITWGTRKLINNGQYRYSTLLVEQTDENGNILNKDKAIFRIVNNTVELTKNADKVLKILLFNGSSNLDTGTNMNYADMVKGDFSPTSYMSFFTTDSNGGLPISTYFPKTPSDAPNAFNIQSVRHSAKQLIKVKNPKVLEQNLKEIVSSVAPLISKEDFINNYLATEENNYFTKVYDSELSAKLLHSKHGIVANSNSIKPITEPDENGEYEAYVTYKTKSGIIFVSRGTIHKIGKARGLKNAQLVGIVSINLDAKGFYTDTPEQISNIISTYYRRKLDLNDVIIGDKTYSKTEYEIDINHPMFKMIRNQFKQEIIDAASAVSHYFEIRKKDNGNYEVVLDNPRTGIWRPHTKDGADLNRGYQNYHIKGKSVITFNNHNNTFHFTGDVFRSSNFIANSTNFFKDIISEDCNPAREDDGTINLLYGGAMELVCDANGKVVDVIFSDKQLDKINECLTGFLDAYINQTTDLIKENAAFIKNVPTDREHIVEYATNNLLMQFNFDYILDGSPKLYKSPQDVIKRVKQYQGSGTPYGSANYSADFVPNMNEAENSFLNNGTISRTETVDGKKVTRDVSITSIFDQYPLLKGVRQRNGFYAVTIENTKRTNTKVLEILRNKLIKECGVSEQHADEIIYGPEETDKETNKKVRTKGYQGTKVNDAQSYITIQEFVRRLSAKGQLKRYLPLIERLMDESKPVSAKDISEFVQVQKNFYCDMFYDERYGIEVVRQIKNAEFVLIPRFIRGTQLMRVYEAMQEAGIDQLNTVETSKAANERILRIWDNNAEFDENTIETFISQAKEDKQIYSYNHLYTQQETPQHMDAENKAGIQVMKKMLDNIPITGHPLSHVKRAFFETYSANIQESCAKLLRWLEIPTDDNGDIIIDNDGTITKYNSKVLYDRLLEEARRTGVNDNQKDYFTIEDGNFAPNMPSYMNNYLSKFESVFQSIFNSFITRQKLPGFHAAQITNVGFKPYGDEEFNVSYSKELQYHPNGEPYIEVMVPYKALGIDKNSKHYANMSDADILKELEEKGLLDFVGYRIPTEGKQSIAVMRIAGFIDDALGSTIVVPDDWVSQTGSDFDIDSVYTILHEHITKRNGEIEKVTYKEAAERTEQDWYNYINDSLNELAENASEEIKDKIAKTKERLNEDIKEAIERQQEAYEELSNKEKEFIKKLHRDIKLVQYRQDLDKREAYLDQLDIVIENIERLKNLNKLPKLENFRDVCEDIYYAINGFKSESLYTTFKEIAEDNNLLSFNDFTNPINDLKANSRKARNSRITDLFLTILRDPTSLEENLSRSNFDKISEAKANKMDQTVLNERANRNPHNVCDQISYQEEVMSGRALKGMSVALDTMCSVCNTVQPTLSEGITVIYNTDEIDIEAAKKGYDCEVDTKNKTLRTTHNTYGWSKNNRTIDGYILTAYSSQTTAYILDAVKEGALLNVNSFTFPAWKTLANLGCSFGVSVAFITQPGVSEIVKAHNAKNSVFTKGYGNEINDAIKNICKRIDPTINLNEPLSAILRNINVKHHSTINNLFGGDTDVSFAMSTKAIAKLPINSKLLDDRNHRTGKFKNPDSIEAAIFDLGIALIYSRLHGIAARIGSVARCCNPDKFGAKQTVYATRKTFDDIIKCIYREEKVYSGLDENDTTPDTTRKEKKPILQVDGKHILEAIYPGVGDINNNGDKDQIIRSIIESGSITFSKYPPLFAFLKYSTCISTIIAKKVFDTQSNVFTSVVEGIGQTFSGANKDVSEEVYTDFQRYLLSSMYNNVPAIKYAIQVRKVDNKIKFIIPTPTDSNEHLAKAETARIWGFGRTTEISTPVEEEYTLKSGIKHKRVVFKRFDVADVTNPTDEEMAEFEQLSPAQKVQFIKSRFNDSEIFSLLHVNLENSRAFGRYRNAQTIEFIEEISNPNDVFRMFKRAFESDNPLVASAAIDIVKYAVQVEGMRTSATAVNKIIDNDCFINDFENSTGLGFVKSMRTQMRNFGVIGGTCGDQLSITNTYENYLRTIPANIPIRILRLTDSNRRRYNMYPISYNTYCIKADAVSEDADVNLQEFNKKLVRMGIKYSTITDEEYGVNQYIQLDIPNKGLMMYKINDLGNQIILTPLTKLEPGENSLWSANPNNNGGAYLSPEAYKKLITSYKTVSAEQAYNALYVQKELANIKNQTEDKSDIVYIDTNKNIKKKANPAFNIEQSIKEDNGAAISLKHDIVSHFTGVTDDVLFVNNRLISENIYTPGTEFGTTQTITFPNGDKHKFSIFIPRNIRDLEKTYLRPKKGTEKADPNNYPFKTARPILKNAQEAGLKFLNNMAVVTQVEDVTPSVEVSDEVYNSTVEDEVVDITTLANATTINAGTHIKLAEFGEQFKNNLFAHDINPNAESVKNNFLTAMEETAAYINKAARYIRDEIFDKFVEDPDSSDGYIKLTSPRIQTLIRYDEALMNKYMQAINMAKAFLEKVEPITHERSDDPQIQGYINDIKNIINKYLEDLPLNELMRSAGNILLKTKSTNPLIRDNFLDVMDGYWKTYGSMWNFFSIMENGTPILQTILSDVMTNIDAKQKLKRKTLKKYRNKVDDIIQRARERGEEIDIHKIIDDNGNFISDYTAEFKEKLNALRDEVKQHPKGSIEHLEAKYKLDEFLLEHVNREAYDEYYRTKLHIERQLLDQIPELYSKYMQLYYRRQEIFDYANVDDLTEDLKLELTNINAEMQNLYLENGYVDENGELHARTIIDPRATYTEEQKAHLRLYSLEVAQILGQKLQELEELENQVFEKAENLTFRRTLKANLKLIEQLERRVNGVPTVSQEILNQNPDYVKAVRWIKENAYFKLNPQYDANSNRPANLAARIFKAFKYLGRSKRNTPINEAFKNPEYRDVKGVIDGRRLTADERHRIKVDDQYTAFPVNFELGYSDRPLDKILISNKKPDNAVFSGLFYKKLSNGKIRNPRFYQIVTELNKLLAPLLGGVDGYIHFERISDNEEGIATLNKIAALYKELVNYSDTDYNEDGEYQGDGVNPFIKQHVEFATNTELFSQQVRSIEGKSDAFKEAIMGVFYLADKDGNYVVDPETGLFVPNRYLYSYPKPKGNPGESSYDMWVSDEEQQARALIDKYYETTTTEYYEYAKEEAIANGTFDQWYEDNHWYNPYTRRIEPISCWIQSRFKYELLGDESDEGRWVPKTKQAIRKVKNGVIQVRLPNIDEPVQRFDADQDKTNHDFKPNAGYLANYKKGSGYDSGIDLNQGEKEMLEFLKDTLISTAKTSKAKKFFDKGQVPRQAKSTDGIGKTIIKNIGKSIGVGLSNNNGYSSFREEIGYAYDEETTMPMLTELNNKITAELTKKLKQLQDEAPVREEDESEVDFNKRVKEHENAVNEIKEQIKKERAAITDNNWYDVIENYLSQAADYNAVNDNKNKLYFLLNILKDMKMYSRKYGSYGDLKKQRVNSDGTKVYQTSVDKNLIEQYENFLRRLLFDEWKEPEGRMTSFGNFLQGFTSANYMMLNFRGGIANVNLGEVNILAEAAARDYIGFKDWGFGTAEYAKGITSYGASAWHYAANGKERFFSKQDAIIKTFNVVDYDEISGVIRNTDLNHYAEQVRNFMFSPQTMGEHFMQNSVLFAVLHSHKIFDTLQGAMAMNKNQYVAYKQAMLLNEVLNEEQLARFNEFKNNIKDDKDELAKYAWFRRDALTRFVYLNCTNEQRKEFNRLRKEQREKFEKEFDAETNIYDQLELTADGELGFVAGSDLEHLNWRHHNNSELTSAQQIIASLSEKTRHINNKIHGIYNRREAANIESKWYGSLVMQYHKHIPMGLVKRYLNRGHWNEFRNSVDKGMVQSVYDFMALNIEKVQQDCGFSKEESTALKSFMFNFTHVFKMVSQLKQTWEIVPEYEKANILRNVGDLFGTVSAIATTALLWAIADDDEPQGFIFNLLLYEADRLASESFMWNPYGMVIEGKKLMSTPIAAGSVINDAFNLLVGVGQWMFDEDYDPYYQSGRFAGEPKASVYIQRRIPIWNGIRNFIDVADNNHYYKVGANPLGILDIKENVRD